MIKVLLTGANGLLGQKLVELYSKDPTVELLATSIGANRNATGSYAYREMNITSEREVKEIITDFAPEVVINTAAMTQVDACETQPEDCWELNVTAVKHLINACNKDGSFLVQLSTDFVFDGRSGPYKETDLPNPLSKYAESKLASEKLLENSEIDYAIVRTMLVYGIVSDMSRSNIILWVKKNLEEGKPIKVVNDQWRTPTLAEDLAKGCALVAAKRASGIFHISGKDLLTPYDMALATANSFQLDSALIEEVDGSIFTQTAQRPPRTGFILDKAKTTLGYNPVSFKEGLEVLKSQLSHV